MSELFDSGFLKKIQQLVIATKLVLADGTGGNRKSGSKGASVEFSDYRQYSAGDDFRRIDWNAYGRFEKLFVKLFMEEKEAPVHIILDTSKSMDWGEPKKSTASRRLAAALGYISLANYDRVSVSCMSDICEKTKPSLRGKNTFGEMIEFLENVDYSRPSDLLAALSGANIKSSKGISVVISDLLPPAGLKDIIKYLRYRKQDVHLCHMLSPQETDPYINSNLRLVDVETESFIDVTASSRVLKSYKKIYSDYMAEIEETCFRQGANHITLDSGMPVELMVKAVTAGT